jgi:hypothetical protein
MMWCRTKFIVALLPFVAACSTPQVCTEKCLKERLDDSSAQMRTALDDFKVQLDQLWDEVCADPKSAQQYDCMHR